MFTWCVRGGFVSLPLRTIRSLFAWLNHPYGTEINSVDESIAVYWHRYSRRDRYNVETESEFRGKFSILYWTLARPALILTAEKNNPYCIYTIYYGARCSYILYLKWNDDSIVAGVAAVAATAATLGAMISFLRLFLSHAHNLRSRFFIVFHLMRCATIRAILTCL